MMDLLLLETRKQRVMKRPFQQLKESVGQTSDMQRKMYEAQIPFLLLVEKVQEKSKRNPKKRPSQKFGLDHPRA